MGLAAIDGSNDQDMIWVYGGRTGEGGWFWWRGADGGRRKEGVSCKGKAGCLTGAISFYGKGICLHCPWEISFIFMYAGCRIDDVFTSKTCS